MTIDLRDPDGFEITLWYDLYADELSEVTEACCYDIDGQPVRLDVDAAVERVGGIEKVRSAVS